MNKQVKFLVCDILLTDTSVGEKSIRWNEESVNLTGVVELASCPGVHLCRWEMFFNKGKIRLNNYFSDECPCQLGVRQKENLSPFELSIYLNGLDSFWHQIVLLDFLLLKKKLQMKYRLCQITFATLCWRCDYCFRKLKKYLQLSMTIVINDT
jgi:hypothetical protein